MGLRLVGGMGEDEESVTGQDRRFDEESTRIGRLCLALWAAIRQSGGVESVALQTRGGDVSPPVVAGAVALDEAKARWVDVMTAEGKSIRTIHNYAERVQACADYCGWTLASHVQYEQAMGFIASRMRNDHDGRAWENGACRSAVSAFRHFGKFLKATGLCRSDPLESLKLPKRRPQVHKHPFTEEEARALVLASITRQQRDRRTKGHAALVWATLFWTGLRHSEVQAACKENPYGGVKWRDVHLDCEFPGILTDPKWIGNKSKSVDWIPLHPRLAVLLRAHREMVLNKPNEPVFPFWPVRATWVEDRHRAGLPSNDQQGRPLSVHAARATFCTWIGKLVLPEGLRDRLSRHELGIAERVYTDRDRSDMNAAVAQLPDIWPPGQGFPDSRPKSFPHGPKALASEKPMCYSVPGTQHVHPHKNSDTPPTVVCQLTEQGSVVLPESGGRPVLEKVDGRPVESLNPDLRIQSDEELLRSTLRSLNLLVQRLACTGSVKGARDEQRSA